MNEQETAGRYGSVETHCRVLCGGGEEKQKLLDIMPKEVRQHCRHGNVVLAASS